MFFYDTANQDRLVIVKLFQLFLGNRLFKVINSLVGKELQSYAVFAFT